MRPALRIIGVGVLGLVLFACGGGGSGSSGKSGSNATTTTTTTTTTYTTYYGVFQGSRVVGVHYKAVLGNVIQEGETDGEGKFPYLVSNGVVSTVTFSVGGVVLGTVTPPQSTGSYSMNVYDLVNSTDPDAGTKALNLQRFLSSINSTPNASVITINPQTRTALTSQKVNLNEVAVDSFTATGTALVNSVTSASACSACATTLATTEAITAHLKDTKSAIDATRVATLELLAGTDAVLADGKTQLAIQLKAVGQDDKRLPGALVHLETTAGTFGTESNLCQESTTVTTSVDRMTDANGMATVMLTPRCQTTNAVVTASLGGV
ncbi:MAG: hypothetical protein HQL95_15770, partial [Magnetococcales bacterium]|nr:hypothetical protein [Magnetococcales bacterium]